jgi:transposase InsO family protein
LLLFKLIDGCSIPENGLPNMTEKGACLVVLWTIVRYENNNSGKKISQSFWSSLQIFSIICSLYKFFLTMGLPAIYGSDQGREFVNSVMSSLIEKTNAVHRISTAYHPQTNGLVERFKSDDTANDTKNL